MQDKDKTKSQLIDELQSMRERLDLLEQSGQRDLSGLEQIISLASARLAGMDTLQVDETVDDVLAAIGKFFNVDRSYVFMISLEKEILVNTHEWCAPGIETQIENLQALPMATFSWWLEQLNRFKSIHIPRVSDLPRNAAAEKDILAAQGIQSVVVVPLVHARDLLGFIGLDAVQVERSWNPSEISLLKTLADLLSNALVRKQSQESLLERNQFITSLLRAIPSAVFYKDKDGKYLGCNKAFSDILGKTEEQIRGKTVYELWPGELAETYHQKDLALMKNPCLQVYDFEIQDKDGILRPVVFAKDVFRGANGEVSGMVGAFLDISERVRVEDELRRTKTSMTAILESAQDSIWSVNTEYNLIYTNPFFANAFFAAFGVHLEPGVSVLGALPEALRPNWKRRYDRGLSGERFLFQDKVEVGDQVIYVEGTANPIIDQERVVGVSFFARDISERVKAEIRQQELLERVKRQQNAIAALALHPTFHAGDLLAAARVLTETVADTLAVERVSVWLSSEKDGAIRCSDLYLRGQQSHHCGYVFRKEDYSAYFAAIEENRVLIVPDATRDLRTRKFVRDYLPAEKNISILGASFRLAGRVVGMVCLEQVGELRDWYFDEINFASQVADQVSQVLANAEQRQAAEALHVSEERYRSLVEDMLDGIYRSTPDGRFVDINPAMVQMFGYASREEMMAIDIEKELYFAPEERNSEDEVETYRMRSKGGSEIWVEGHGRYVYDEDGEIIFNEGILRDVTERINSQRALQESEKKFRDMYLLLRRMCDTVPDMIWAKDTEGKYIFANQAICNQLLMAVDTDEPVGKTDLFFALRERGSHSENPAWHTFGEVCANSDAIVLENARAGHFEEFGNVRSKFLYLDVNKAPLFDENGELIGVVGSARDVTRRKKSEQITQAHLRLAPLSFTCTMPEFAQKVLDESEIITASKAGFFHFIENDGHTILLQAWSTKTLETMCKMKPEIQHYPIEQAGVWAQAVRDGKPHIYNDYDNHPLARGLPDGHAPITRFLCMPILEKGRVIAILGVGNKETDYTQEDVNALSEFLLHISDIFLRKRVEDSLRDNEERLRLAISAGNQGLYDLNLKTGHGVVNEEYEHMLGYEPGELQESLQKLFGRMPVEDRKLLKSIYRDFIAGKIPEFRVEFRQRAKGGGWKWVLSLGRVVEYDAFGNPLRMLGTLTDITDRKHAEQALKKAAHDLEDAYTATLQGWSNALEMREHETAGHSKRVVVMTIHLARAMGIPEEDLVHVQRGALLHDIGKMGIPDSILLKPGPLSEDEWVIMRQHPEFAHRMISKIPYLQKALDIPYSHHERWDGSGYPRGLQGEEIPLAARVFAVVDAWDALSYDRPYRPSWPEKNVLEYLSNQVGKKFDPQVVDVFVKLLKRSRPPAT
jgi:PAS domain S-box-containing protein/putative nucleotidyltransferase with HDIG domain